MKTIKEEMKMYDVSELFYSPNGTPIEGYLGDDKECEILFVLREPHEDNAQHFWFKEDVVNCKNKGEEKLKNRYFKSLGTLAYKLLGEEKDDPDVGALEDALRKCAYINIYPFSGENEASSHYDNTLRELKKTAQNNPSYTNEPVLISSNSFKCYGRIAMNRRQIINNLDWKILVTVCGAFEAITNKTSDKCCVGITVGYKNSQEKERKKFRVACIEGRKVLSFYHPSHACSCNVSNDLLSIPDCLIMRR